MKYVKVPEQLWVGIVAYLEGRPFKEVAPALIQIAQSKFEVIEEATPELKSVEPKVE